jgi:hypothetical protein
MKTIYKESGRLLGSDVPDEFFDVKEGSLWIRADNPILIKKSLILHGIWEALLNILGQYYNHSGFHGFSQVFHYVITSNGLSWVFTPRTDDYPVAQLDGVSNDDRET